MLRVVEKLDSYRYVCNDIIISIDGNSEPIKISGEYVQGLICVKDYDDRIIPFISINIQVPKAQYQKLESNMSKLNVLLSIDKYKVSESSTKFKVNVIKGKFRAINQSLLDPSLASQFKSVEPSDNAVQDTSQLQLYLYDEDILLKARKMSSLLINSTISTAIYHLFKDRGFNNVLFSPIPNDTAFIKIRLPYSNLMKSLSMLNDIYGIYNNPYTFFMDFKCTYLLDNGSLGKAVQNLEYGTVVMYLEENGSHASTDVGCYVDKENGKCIINLNYIPRISDIDSSMEHAMWGKMTGIISGTKKIVKVASSNTFLEKAVITKNAKVLNQEMFKLNENKRVIDVIFTDIDMDIISPNKLFTIVDHQEYEKTYKLKGNYRLSKSLIILEKTGASDMQLSIRATMKKIK